MPDEFTSRPARREDAAAIAGLFSISSDGLAEYIWSRIGAPGLSWRAIVPRPCLRYADGDAMLLTCPTN